MSRKKQAVTMWDVAKLAGVSQATVSLVLNNVDSGRVTEETRARVRAAVTELDYRTNAFAKSLRSGQSGIIGFISDEVASAPFSGKLLKGAQLRAWESGNVILSIDTFSNPDLEAAAIDMMLSYRVRGIVYAAMYHRVIDLPEALNAVPTVVVNARDRSKTAPSVFPNEELGGYVATRRLIDNGHHRVAMINIQGQSSDLPAATGRFAGYRRALTEAGLSTSPALLRIGEGDVGDGYRLTLELLADVDPPTAIFCGNDRTAWGAYQALTSLGLRVPQDCSIVGFDNQEILAPNLQPGLTTMELPFEQMASRAVELLLSEGPLRYSDNPIDCELISRGSVAPRGN